MNASAGPDEQIFVDASGRRKKLMRWTALGLCVPLAGYLGLLATGVVSSSPLGTPPWVADEHKGDGSGTPDGDKPAATDSSSPGSGRPSARPSAKPGQAPKTQSAPGGATGVPALPAGTTAPPPGTVPPPGATTAAAPTTKPGTIPPGQTRRPTAQNTNKGGH